MSFVTFCIMHLFPISNDAQEVLHTIRAGLTIVPVVPWEGASAAGGPLPTADFLPCCFDV